jgi:hypothetical protein
MPLPVRLPARSPRISRWIDRGRGNLAARFGFVDNPFPGAARGRYSAGMRLFFWILASILVMATLGTLMVGITGMGAGGEFNRKYGNKLMRLRVILQGLAIACFVLGWISG